MKIKRASLFLVFLLALSGPLLCENIPERFQGQKKLVYGVYFSGIPVGSIEWAYLGDEIVNGKNAHVLSIDSDTDILKVFNLESKEKVFIDVGTGLPLKVERDVVFLGKKEVIREFYNQEAGSVRIEKSNSTKEEEVLLQDKPIHNILALLYFFPKGIDLELGEMHLFNLPTQKVKIKMVSRKKLDINGGKKEAYFLSGKGDRRFNLWLDIEERLPLRMEFLLLVGKIIIKREFKKISNK